MILTTGDFLLHRIGCTTQSSASPLSFRLILVGLW